MCLGDSQCDVFASFIWHMQTMQQHCTVGVLWHHKPVSSPNICCYLLESIVMNIVIHWCFQCSSCFSESSLWFLWICWTFSDLITLLQGCSSPDPSKRNISAPRQFTPAVTRKALRHSPIPDWKISCISYYTPTHPVGYAYLSIPKLQRHLKSNAAVKYLPWTKALFC